MISRIHIGVDISKKWFDVHALAKEAELVRRYTNTPEGQNRFIQDAQALGAKKVQVCMEFTGGYETSLAIGRKEAGLLISIVDGARIAHYRRSFSSTGAGTDKKSAFLLARFCKERRPEEWFPAPSEYRKLRELVRHRDRLVRSASEWACRASCAAEDELVQSQRVAIAQVLRMQVKETEAKIQAHVEEHQTLAEPVRLLQTIPGIGIKSACLILAEMGPVQNYASAKALALAAGLVPIVVHSGQKVPPGKLPVYGNMPLRTGLFFPTLVCKRNGQGVGSFMERLGHSDKTKMTVVVAGMRKLAHVIYGVLTHQLPYNPQHMT